MPFQIQRVPKGLNDLLSAYGGITPHEMEDRVQGSLELIQFYGLQQRQLLAVQNAALAEAGFVSIAGGGAGIAEFTQRWAVLFAATAQILKTATATALNVSVLIARGGSGSIPYATAELGPFGATETGSVHVPFVAPYPILMPPPWNVSAGLNILGTDANANVIITAEVGILG